MADPLDSGVPALGAEQCRAARAMLGWSVGDLAGHAGVTGGYVEAFEQGREPGDGNDPNESVRMRRALEHAGIEFIDAGLPSAGGGPGLRLRSTPSYIQPENLSSANDV
ncbi:helix-turn-helix domain-containing protein [Ancylobacter defluvii]|uniref:Transcriptional regulator n=1 Tax=Ancylobacter defluvii TaxID=1282440 RepID=A0A9W6JSC5_9HYPH|nr:XRE family transcriptional regulator [Ancylobacter defluvii]MBS7589816.1 XRE family transcriptional regulator [Ancylobacter defluvii]GLK82935.1 hypothetical protein GCM10017653_10040 [Ancylobacter defluvii]